MKNLLLLLALTHLTALANLPNYANPHYHGSQAWQQQQALGAYMTDQQNQRRAATPAQQAPVQLKSTHLTGFHSQFNAIAVVYNDDILLDNYSNPLPFSWERYRDMRTDIDGMRLEDLSPINGFYRPFSIVAATDSIKQPLATSAAEAEAAARLQCAGKPCEIAAVYSNTCNAIAVGWLHDFSGVRLYTADNAYYRNRYGKNDVVDWDIARELVHPAINDAMRRCQSDPAVRAASCETFDSQALAGLCALPAQHIEWR